MVFICIMNNIYKLQQINYYSDMNIMMIYFDY